MVGVESGGLKSERQEEMEFQHQFFLKGMKPLLDNIKRKVSSSAGGAGRGAHYLPSLKTEKVNEVLSEVTQIKDKQEDLDSKLDSMKKENEALWREVVSLRQKHQSQQKIVNKLIQFLVSMVQPRMVPPAAVKRRYQGQLAIEDAFPPTGGGGGAGGVSPAAKEMRLETLLDAAASSVGGQAGAGPNIQDVTNAEASGSSTVTLPSIPASSSAGGATFTVESIVGGGGAGQVIQPAASTSSSNVVVNVELPDTPEAASASASAPSFPSSVSVTPAAMRAVDPSLVNPAISAASSAAASLTRSPSKLLSRPTLMRELSKEDLDMETTFTQKEIDNLKDVLSGQVNIDPSLLTNLFSPEEPLPNMMFSSTAAPSVAAAAAAATGGKTQGGPALRLEMDGGPVVATVTPSLLELAEMDEEGGEGSSSAAAAARSTPGAAAAAASLVTPDALNTPLIFYDDSNPLVAHLKK